MDAIPYIWNIPGERSEPALRKNRTILLEKLKESLASVLPVTGIVFLLCFTVVPVPTDILMAFVVGAVLLVIGHELAGDSQGLAALSQGAGILSRASLLGGNPCPSAHWRS